MAGQGDVSHHSQPLRGWSEIRDSQQEPPQSPGSMVPQGQRTATSPAPGPGRHHHPESATRSQSLGSPRVSITQVTRGQCKWEPPPGHGLPHPQGPCRQGPKRPFGASPWSQSEDAAWPAVTRGTERRREAGVSVGQPPVWAPPTPPHQQLTLCHTASSACLSH